MDGVLVIDKPAGPTSHDVVARARRALGERRIGHTGTLNPAASGVLPLVVGRATRLARFLSAGVKSYEAAIRLGLSTDTGDAQGIGVWAPSHHARPSRDTINQALATFRGTFLQQPPAYSAKKIDGHRSYDLARARARRTRRPAPGTRHPDPAVLPSLSKSERIGYLLRTISAHANITTRVAPADAVGRRRRLLDYLVRAKDVQRYADLIKRLNIRK